jgi:hypothetical protein
MQTEIKTNRLAYLDNLKAVMIIFVEIPFYFGANYE